MRLNKFESAGLKPLGEGDHKRSFINPKNEREIISETKKETEKDTLRQLKGRYYLTKIVHLLLPENIPDIYQAGESHDGAQTVDTERISHTSGHTLLQEARQSGGNEEPAKKQIIEEMGEGMGELDLNLERIGLSFNIDENVGNYTKDEAGNVHYLETFKPWQTDLMDPKELEILFDEEALRESIGDISDQKVKEKCTRLLERLLVILDEEKREIRENYETNLEECDSHIEELEQILTPFLEDNFLAVLGEIETENEALNSKERKSAKKALSLILNKLNILRDKTNITREVYDGLYEEYKKLSRAVGMINRGIVNHNG